MTNNIPSHNGCRLRLQTPIVPASTHIQSDAVTDKGITASQQQKVRISKHTHKTTGAHDQGPISNLRKTSNALGNT